MSKKKTSRNKRTSALSTVSKPINPVINANLIAQALQYHEQNQLDKALSIYKQVLKNDPKNTVALQYVGLIAHLQGDDAKCIRLMQKALALDPEYSVCASNLARILYKRGEFQQAKTYNQQAIACDAYNEDALSNLGNIYLREHEFSVAEVQFKQALNLNPHNVEALIGLGDLETEIQAWKTAAEFYQRALQANPNNVDTYNHFGQLYFLQHEYAEAETYFQAGLKIEPQHLMSLCYLGQLHTKQKQFPQALKYLRKGLKIDPQHLEILCNLGKIFIEQQQFNQALTYLNQALKIDATNISTLCNLGKLFIEQQQFTHANKYLHQALQLNPKHIDVQVGLGMLAATTGNTRESWQYYQIALQINPKHVATQYNLAYTELKLANYRNGFKLYETRTQQFAADYQDIHKFPTEKLWQGETINQQTLLVCWEQGFGDEIQFARYLNLLSSKCNNIVFWCQAALVELFSVSFPSIKVIANTQPMPTYDKYVFLLSLPHLFGTEVTTIPNQMPYLLPSPKTVENLEINSQKFNIGIIWAGNKDYSNDINRSIQLKPLLPLLNTPQSQFYSLQIGVNSQDITELNVTNKIIDCSTMIHDFADTARIIQQLDLVISIDSGVAHLAGALNKPVWICLPLVADWRWLEQRTDSVWYPSARLFRQTKRQDWTTVIADLQQALTTAVQLKLT